MESNANNRHVPFPAEVLDEPGRQFVPGAADDWKLRRWLVSLRSGTSWYSVGEFIALSEIAAIERAVEIFGQADGYQGEVIPWDAAPLPRMNRGLPGQ